MADPREKIGETAGQARALTEKTGQQVKGAAQAAGQKAKEVAGGVVEAAKDKVQDVAAGASALAGKATDTAQAVASTVAGRTSAGVHGSPAAGGLVPPLWCTSDVWRRVAALCPRPRLAAVAPR
jgi:hypothetical protein